MPAQAGMTAMDTQSTRDARGAGSGGNATGFQRSDVSEQPLPIKNEPVFKYLGFLSMDSGLKTCRYDVLSYYMNFMQSQLI